MNHTIVIGNESVIVDEQYRTMQIDYLPAGAHSRGLRWEFATSKHGAMRIRRLYRAARKGGLSVAVARWDIYALLNGSIYASVRKPMSGVQTER